MASASLHPQSQSPKDSSKEHPLLNSVSCSICFELFRDPRLLSCHHSFCRKCLIDIHSHEQSLISPEDILISNLQGIRSFPKIQCPTCRKISLVPGGGINNLPQNFALDDVCSIIRSSRGLMKLVDPDADFHVVEQQNLADQEKAGQSLKINMHPQKASQLENQIPIKTFCANCPKEALSYCNQCEVYMCEPCIESTHAHKIFQGHKFITLAAAKLKLESNELLELLKCPTHPPESFRFYCITCEQFVCRDCIVVDHHFDHIYISVRQATSASSEQIKSFDHLARANIPVLIQRSEENEHLVNNLGSSLELARRKIIGYSDFAISVVNFRRDQMKHSIRKLFIQQVALVNTFHRMLCESDFALCSLEKIVSAAGFCGPWPGTKDNSQSSNLSSKTLPKLYLGSTSESDMTFHFDPISLAERYDRIRLVSAIIPFLSEIDGILSHYSELSPKMMSDLENQVPRNSKIHASTVIKVAQRKKKKGVVSSLISLLTGGSHTSDASPSRSEKSSVSNSKKPSETSDSLDPLETRKIIEDIQLEEIDPFIQVATKLESIVSIGAINKRIFKKTTLSSILFSKPTNFSLFTLESSSDDDENGTDPQPEHDSDSDNDLGLLNLFGGDSDDDDDDAGIAPAPAPVPAPVPKRKSTKYAKPSGQVETTELDDIDDPDTQPIPSSFLDWFTSIQSDDPPDDSELSVSIPQKTFKKVSLKPPVISSSADSITRAAAVSLSIITTSDYVEPFASSDDDPDSNDDENNSAAKSTTKIFKPPQISQSELSRLFQKATTSNPETQVEKNSKPPKKTSRTKITQSSKKKTSRTLFSIPVIQLLKTDPKSQCKLAVELPKPQNCDLLQGMNHLGFFTHYAAVAGDMTWLHLKNAKRATPVDTLIPTGFSDVHDGGCCFDSVRRVIWATYGNAGTMGNVIYRIFMDKKVFRAIQLPFGTHGQQPIYDGNKFVYIAENSDTQVNSKQFCRINCNTGRVESLPCAPNPFLRFAKGCYQKNQVWYVSNNAPYQLMSFNVTSRLWNSQPLNHNIVQSLIAHPTLHDIIYSFSRTKHLRKYQIRSNTWSDIGTITGWESTISNCTAICTIPKSNCTEGEPFFLLGHGMLMYNADAKLWVDFSSICPNAPSKTDGGHLFYDPSSYSLFYHDQDVWKMVSLRKK